jgi:hypothetical protein
VLTAPSGETHAHRLATQIDDDVLALLKDERFVKSLARVVAAETMSRVRDAMKISYT